MADRIGLEVCDTCVELLGSGALFIPRFETLLVADLHLGKARAFRAWGLPVPGGTTESNLTRLSCDLRKTGARRLVILGDLWHAAASLTEQSSAQVGAWISEQQIEVQLVAGNHDLRAGLMRHPVPGLDLIESGSELGPFQLFHDPEAVTSGSGYGLAGHIHPCVKLEGVGRQSARLKCFWFGETVGVLPAYGEFTGGYRIHPSQSDQVFGLCEGSVFALT